jgi:threonine synthase
MGLPVHRILVATNENDILNRFFTTGQFSRGHVVKTISPSIDIQVPYNFERLLYYLADEDPIKVKEWMLLFKETGSLDLVALLPKANEYVISSSVKDSDTKDAIRQYYSEYKYLLDPHSAVGVAAALKLKSLLQDKPLVCLATAHACKFAEAMKEALPGVEATPPPPHTAPSKEQKTYHKELKKSETEAALRSMVHDAYFKSR